MAFTDAAGVLSLLSAGYEPTFERYTVVEGAEERGPQKATPIYLVKTE